MPIALTLIGLLVFSFLLGTLFNFTSLFLAIPLILIYFGGLLGSEGFARQKRNRFRLAFSADRIELAGLMPSSHVPLDDVLVDR